MADSNINPLSLSSAPVHMDVDAAPSATAATADLKSGTFNPTTSPEVEWIHLKRDSSRDRPDSNSVSVVTYNILANCYIKEATDRHPLPIFPYVTDRSKLSFEARAPRILARLAAIDADIVCLQEVERPSYWMKQLGELGYYGKFAQRPNDIREVGVATFWKTVKFQMSTSSISRVIDLNEAGPNMWEARSIEDYNDYQRNNSGLVMSLCYSKDLRAVQRVNDMATTKFSTIIRGPSTVFVPNMPVVIVGNFHAFWDPKLPLVKLRQTKCMLHCMGWPVAQGTSAPKNFILTGDFNSLPDSQVYAALAGEKGLSGSHAMQLKLATDKMKAAGLDPKVEALPPLYTNYTHDFVGTLDYIWYSDEGLEPLAILKLGTEEELKAEVGLPNSREPSDHVPVAMRFLDTH